MNSGEGEGGGQGGTAGEVYSPRLAPSRTRRPDRQTAVACTNSPPNPLVARQPLQTTEDTPVIPFHVKLHTARDTL
jgi:hypothetical protein